MSDSSGTLLFARSVAGIDRARIRAFYRLLGRTVTGGASFTCLITRDAELQRLNREFLGKDEATDVLSFPSPEDRSFTVAQKQGAFLGDIAISLDRALDQAARFGHSPEDEIRILMLHGALHLVGYDHHGDRGRMARIEKRWRAALDLPAGLIERSRRRGAA